MQLIYRSILLMFQELVAFETADFFLVMKCRFLKVFNLVNYQQMSHIKDSHMKDIVYGAHTFCQLSLLLFYEGFVNMEVSLVKFDFPNFMAITVLSICILLFKYNFVFLI